MRFYLLDAGALGLVVGVAIVFMIITIVLEAVVMILLKYNKAGKSFLHSILINLVSLCAGFAISLTGAKLFDLTDSPLLSILILFLITVAVEFAVLYLLNKKLPVQKTLMTAIVINLVSYLLFYIIKFFT